VTRSVDLPSALTARDLLAERLRSGKLVVALDYDGTLCPIVERPEAAAMSEAMRRTLDQLTGRCPVVVLSGRGLDDLRTRVSVERAWCSGCHGFEIAGPERAYVHPAAARCEPLLVSLADELEASLGDMAGVVIERKRYAVAVHLRMVAAEQRERVEEAVKVARPGLACKRGHQVYEFVPEAEWNKGRALEWIIDALGRSDVFPVFIGDDRTDEDAFLAVRDRGLAIVVSTAPRATAATMRLSGPDEVYALLETLAGGC
jgi:trehalose-phosphatase